MQRSCDTSCDPVFPERLFEPQETSKTADQLLKSALEEEGEGEGEEEEEEREEEGEKENGEDGGGGGEGGGGGVINSEKPASRFTGTGLNTLLRMDETAVQNHGSLSLDLPLSSIGLIAPLAEEEPQPELKRWYSADPDPTPSIPLSLDEYLGMCERHLQMGLADVRFARWLYEEIAGQGVRGATMETLRGQLDPPGENFGPSWGLEEHVQSLLNFEMV